MLALAHSLLVAFSGFSTLAPVVPTHVAAFPPVLKVQASRLSDERRSCALHMQASQDFRQRRFDRRNMNIDERRAFDELVAKREAETKARNAALAVLAVIAAAAVASDPTQFEAIVSGGG